MLTLSENMLTLKIMIYIFFIRHFTFIQKKYFISNKTKYHQDVLISNQGERKINTKMKNKNVPKQTAENYSNLKRHILRKTRSVLCF